MLAEWAEKHPSRAWAVNQPSAAWVAKHLSRAWAVNQPSAAWVAKHLSLAWVVKQPLAAWVAKHPLPVWAVKRRSAAWAAKPVPKQARAAKLAVSVLPSKQSIRRRHGPEGAPGNSAMGPFLFVRSRWNRPSRAPWARDPKAIPDAQGLKNRPLPTVFQTSGKTRLSHVPIPSPATAQNTRIPKKAIGSFGDFWLK